jgi:chromosome segregation ATPase
MTAALSPTRQAQADAPRFTAAQCEARTHGMAPKEAVSELCTALANLYDQVEDATHRAEESGTQAELADRELLLEQKTVAATRSLAATQARTAATAASEAANATQEVHRLRAALAMAEREVQSVRGAVKRAEATAAEFRAAAAGPQHACSNLERENRELRDALAKMKSHVKTLEQVAAEKTVDVAAMKAEEKAEQKALLAQVKGFDSEQKLLWHPK